MNLALLRGLTSTNTGIVSARGNASSSTPAAQPQARTQTQTEADAVFTPSTTNQASNDLSRFRAAQMLFTPPVSNGGESPTEADPVASPPTPETSDTSSPAPSQDNRPATNPIPQSNRTTSEALDLLNGSFNTVDTSGDGFLSEDEISTFQSQQSDLSPELQQALGQVAEAVPALMFTNIDPTDDAFFGIGRADIRATNEALRDGESLEQIQDRVAEETIEGQPFFRAFAQARGGDVRDALGHYVSVARRSILRRRERGFFPNGGG